jgi:hypothetical protein
VTGDAGHTGPTGPTGEAGVSGVITVEGEFTVGQKTTTVTCPKEHPTAISGGFIVQGSVTESYRSDKEGKPTGTTSWTVTQSSNAKASEKVFVYCG